MTGREEKVGRYRGDAHRVRPTASWAALGVLVLGVVVVGVGVLVMSWPVAAAGAAVGVAGAALWNVHGATGASRTTREDGTVEVAGTHAHLEDAAAQRHAAEVSRRAKHLEHQGPPRRPGLARAGAALVLATGTWLALSQWTLYAETPEGREGTWRAMGAAIVVLLAALRLLAPGRSLPAVAAAVVVGLLLVPSGLLLAETARAAASETISGILTVLGALLTLDRTTPAPTRPRDAATRP
jgi:uncharacterized membrane protein HdeD (DUF308 family)